MATPRLVELIDRYKDAHGVSDAELARRIGITRENLRLWRINGVRRLPERANLAAVARVIGQPYRQVLSAALFDTGYQTARDTTAPRLYDEVLYDAIAALTEAAHLTNQPMRQTSSGQWEPDPDPRAALPIDWAEFVTHALAGAAANVGGTEQILAGCAIESTIDSRVNRLLGDFIEQTSSA
jgi:transcriptional regulator with XRE-family HTH domain